VVKVVGKAEILASPPMTEEEARRHFGDKFMVDPGLLITRLDGSVEQVQEDGTAQANQAASQTSYARRHARGCPADYPAPEITHQRARQAAPKAYWTTIGHAAWLFYKYLILLARPTGIEPVFPP
jgi:hypothetical protein